MITQYFTHVYNVYYISLHELINPSDPEAVSSSKDSGDAVQKPFARMRLYYQGIFPESEILPTL